MKGNICPQPQSCSYPNCDCHAAQRKRQPRPSLWLEWAFGGVLLGFILWCCYQLLSMMGFSHFPFFIR